MGAGGNSVKDLELQFLCIPLCVISHFKDWRLANILVLAQFSHIVCSSFSREYLVASLDGLALPRKIKFI